MRWRYLLPLGIVVLLMGLLAVGLKLNPREVPSPLLGKPAPAFVLPRLDDPQKTFSSADLAGEVTLVNVWASWCASCRDEADILLSLSRKNIVRIYGLDYKDEREDAIKWLDQFGNPYQLSVADSEGRVGIDWGVYGVPETFVLDRRGYIRYKHIGAVSEKDLLEKLLPLIAQLQKES